MHRMADALAGECEAPPPGSLLLGVATMTWEYSDARHPIFEAVFDGIESRSRAGNCDVVLFTTTDRHAVVYLRRCLRNGLDGLVLHGFNADDPRVSALLAALVPCVAVADGGRGLAAIESAGLRVPDDVALVGFDDVPLASHVSPGLTTLRQNARRQGITAADAVLRMILDPESEPRPCFPST